MGVSGIEQLFYHDRSYNMSIGKNAVVGPAAGDIRPLNSNPTSGATAERFSHDEDVHSMTVRRGCPDDRVSAPISRGAPNKSKRRFGWSRSLEVGRSTLLATLTTTLTTFFPK